MTSEIPRLRGRLAEVGIRHADFARYYGIHPTFFSAILTGRRKAPEDFAERAHLLVDRFEAANAAARAAWERAMEEGDRKPLVETGVPT